MRDTRVPLILAGVAAGITYLILGSSSPFDGFHISRLHHHLKDSAAAVIGHVDPGSERPETVSEDYYSAKAALADGTEALADGERALADARRRAAAADVSPADVNVDEVVLQNTAGATITIGEKPAVHVVDGNASRNQISTVIHDGKMTITSIGAPVRLAVTLPHLKSLRVNGPGNVTLVGLRDPLSIVTNGPATVQATGTVDSLNLTLNGPSILSLTKLEAKNVAIRMNGGGNAEVFASKSLVAEVHGVGSVRYLGDPVTVTSVSGNGSIERLIGAKQS